MRMRANIIFRAYGNKTSRAASAAFGVFRKRTVNVCLTYVYRTFNVV